MSQRNVEAVRAVYEQWATGNFRAGGDLYDQHVLYVPLADLPDGGERHLGPDGIRQYMRGQLQAWTKLTIAGEDFIDAGDSVVVNAVWRGVGEESGTPVEWRGCHVWSFRGRVVTRLELFRDRASALEAVGLSE